MNVVDYVTSEIELFRFKLYLPKYDVNAPSNGRYCLYFGLLVFIDFHKNKTRQTKNVANTVVSDTRKFQSHNAPY